MDKIYRKSLRIYDRIDGTTKYEDWFMEDFDTAGKEAFADAIRDFAIKAWEIVMEDKPPEDEDEYDD